MTILSLTFDMTPRDLGLPSKFQSFRRGQEDVAMSIATSESRFNFLSAPTGSGKSVVYLSIAQLLGARTLVLTGTKALQQQLLSDFQSIGMVDVRGHGNYPCGLNSSSEIGPKSLVPSTDTGVRGGGRACSAEEGSCQWEKAIKLANESNLVVSNYAMWLTMERLGRPGLLGEFDLLVLDEGHTAKDWLAKFSEFKLNDVELKSLLRVGVPKKGSDVDWIEWIGQVIELATCEINSTAGGKDKSTLKGLVTNLSKIVESSNQGVEWLVDYTVKGIKLRPVWAWPYAEQFLFRGIEKVVVSSATLFREDAGYLGLNNDHVNGVDTYSYHEVESSFPVENRPFIYVPTCRVDHRMSEGDLRILVNRIDSIIGGRLDRKGVIHSRSYRWAGELMSRSKYKELMIAHDPGGVVQAVMEFRKANEPSILVSPAVVEGFDFAEDDCRFQILLKVPFVDSRDEVIKLRSKADKGYLNYLAALDLVQMYGRPVRSETDVAEAFILDEHWGWFRKKANFPRWFTESWKQLSSVPQALDI